MLHEFTANQVDTVWHTPSGIPNLVGSTAPQPGCTGSLQCNHRVQGWTQYSLCPSSSPVPLHSAQGAVTYAGYTLAITKTSGNLGWNQQRKGTWDRWRDRTNKNSKQKCRTITILWLFVQPSTQQMYCHGIFACLVDWLNPFPPNDPKHHCSSDLDLASRSFWKWPIVRLLLIDHNTSQARLCSMVSIK